MKAYTLKIIDPLTNVEIVKITEKNGYHIETTISNVALSSADSLNIINIYNANMLFQSRLIQDKLLILEAGLVQDGLTQLQSYNPLKLTPKVILQGYVYDVINDFSGIPNPKTIIRTAAYPRDKLQDSNDEVVVVFKKNDNFYNFINDVAKKYCNITIDTPLQSIKHIVNKVQDLTFRFNARDIQVLTQLDNFIRTTSSTMNSKVPIMLSTSQTGYILVYDYRVIEDKELKAEVTSSLSLDQFTLDTSMILKAPSITEVNKIQLQTVLLPSVKVGSIININKDILFSNSNPTHRIYDQGKVVESIKGLWYVIGINHSLSYMSSNPISYSSLLECIKL